MAEAKVMIGGVERTLSPLKMKTIRALSKREAAARRGELDQEAVLDLGYDLILASLQQKHPELTKEQLEDDLDFPQYKALLAETKRVSDLETAPGEAGRPAGTTTGSSSSGG